MSAKDFSASRAHDHGITRRQVLAGAGAVAAGALPAAMSATTVAAAQADAAPTSGGTVILGYTDEPPTMDPRVSGSAKATNLMVNLFDTLITVDVESEELRPGRAALPTRG